MNVCSKCGRVLSGGIVFCDSCGARAVAQQQNESVSPPITGGIGSAPPPQNYAPPPPGYDQPPPNYTPPPQQYNPVEQSQFVPANDNSDENEKKAKKKTTLFIVLNIALGLIGYIIAANMATFGIGEILMLAAAGFGIAIKKPIGFILAAIDLFMLLDLWFLGFFL